MNTKQFWNIDNVSTFRMYDVNSSGEVELTNEEWRDILNEMYGSVEVCGQTFEQGTLLEDADPVAFREGKSAYEDKLQRELDAQLENEDSSDIEFVDGDEFELEDEDDADDEQEDEE